MGDRPQSENGERCHNCGTLNDDATDINNPDARPTEGDVSVCFYCAALALFTGDGYGTRAPTEEERLALLADPLVTETTGHVLLYNALDRSES